MPSFVSVLKKAKASTQFKKSRDKKYEAIPAGSYATKLTDFECDVDDGTPYVKFTFTISRGKFKGRVVSDRIKIEDRSGKTAAGKAWEFTKEQCIDNIMRIARGLGIDTEGLDADELEEEIKAVIEDEITITVKLVQSGDYTNVRGVKVDDDAIDDDDTDDDDEEEEEEDDSEEDEDEEEDDEEDDEDDEDDDDEDDEDEPWVPSKGEEVQHKVRGKLHTCTVKTVNKTKETCSLIRESDNRTFANVPWDKVIA